MNKTINSAAHSYRQIQVGTSSHSRLVCMLHEQCCMQLRRAVEVSTPLRRPLLDRVRKIIFYLQRSVALSDITSKLLYDLYGYCIRLCEQDNMDVLKNAVKIMETLQRTFDDLQRNQ